MAQSPKGSPTQRMRARVPGSGQPMSAAIDSGRVVAGRYRLTEVLGSGGMGTVWLAVDQLLDRQVAVKEVLPPPDVTDAESQTLRDRTLREARMAARLNHPNVVTVYDVVEDGNRPWIVMELVQARSLRDIVEQDGPLTAQRAAKVGLQVLAALRAAHRLEIVHRDVKPGNVLIDDDGRAVLADFGIARGLDGATLTTSEVLVGSPSYIAPERAHGEPGGPGSDLWSLGATLYAAVEGRPPYQREGAVATLAAVVTQDPDPPRQVGPLWPVISGLLRRDQELRLGPEAADSMLQTVAAAGDPAGTAPLVAATRPEAPAAVAAAAASQPDPGTLRSAEQTRAFHRAGPPTATAGQEAGAVASSPAAAPAGGQEAGAVASSPAAAPAGGQEAGAVASSPAAAPAGGQEAGAALPPGPQFPDPAAGAGRPARRRWWLTRGITAAAVAVVLIALGTVGHHLAQVPQRHRSAARTPASSYPASPHPASSPATSTPSAPAGAGGHNPSPGAAQPATVPAGYRRYRDPTGFSIAVPDGWSVSHSGHLVYLSEPAGRRYLLIDQTNHPQPDPLADWRQQEANRIGTYPGYHRIRLEAIRYPQAEKAADWEFTYNGKDGPVHVLNRNVLASSTQAYALYWSTPATEWSRSYHIFKVLAATFQPA